MAMTMDKFPHPLSPELADKTWSARESWRVLGIMAEFVQATDKLSAIRPAVSFFGSARMMAGHPYYALAERTARLLSDAGFSVMSGGGPGIMEAANRGASEAKGENVGLNISLPFEQLDNPYITRRLAFEFHYFFMRKFWFSYLAKAMVVMPGGFGTFDEFMEVVTLVQTLKIKKHMPIVLFGTEYWNEILNFEPMVRYGTISPEDLNLFFRTDSVDEAFDYLVKDLEAHALKKPNAGYMADQR